MKKYKPVMENYRSSKSINYKQLFIERGFYWDSIQEYIDKGFNVNIPLSYWFKEAVIRPEKYVEILYNIIKGIINNNEGRKFDTPESICEFLSSKFKMFNIQFEKENRFEDQDSMKSGINIMATSHTDFLIIILCSPVIKNLFIDMEIKKYFLKTFKELIGHELIHRSQFLYVTDYKRREIIFKKSKEDIITYFSRKTEIMSYAWQIIEQFRFQGMTNDEILNYIKTKRKNLDSDNNIFDYYIYTFKDSFVLKLLFKYMYEYLKGDLNMNEVKFF